MDRSLAGTLGKLCNLFSFTEYKFVCPTHKIHQYLQIMYKSNYE